jgi:glycosyltransferase involved in cell wall biosynthesis
MKVSIGMLAYNEAAGIKVTIASLLSQSVFQKPSQSLGISEWELIVVPNGCTDNTADVAASNLQDLVGKLSGVKIVWSVKSLTEGGKSNAWNQYIHSLSNREADIIVMMDSDIEFGHVDTIFNCVHELQTNVHARVVVDLPIKDFAKKPDKNWLEKISDRSSKMQLEGRVGLSGQFYCAHSKTLREVWMPKGLSGEDGFLNGMIATDLFRTEPDSRRVVRAKNASHYYEGLTSLRSIFHHELRMVIGTCMNCYFMWDFLKFATLPTGNGAGGYIKTQLDSNPNWYRQTIENQIRNRGLFVIPRDMLLRRFRVLKGVGPLEALRRLPVALCALLLDIPIFLLANRKIKNGSALGFW